MKTPKKSECASCKGKDAAEAAKPDKDCLTCPPVDRNVVYGGKKKRRRLRPKKL